jgi:hypothetical protein
MSSGKHFWTIKVSSPSKWSKTLTYQPSAWRVECERRQHHGRCLLRGHQQELASYEVWSILGLPTDHVSFKTLTLKCQKWLHFCPETVSNPFLAARSLALRTLTVMGTHVEREIVLVCVWSSQTTWQPWVSTKMAFLWESQRETL